MFSSQKNFKTGIYRITGSVINWNFRINLKKIYSLIEIPRFDQPNETDACETPNCEVEQLDISWQEKVFSRYEIDYFSVRENCSSELQKSYHNMIKSSGLAENRTKEKIFTYTSADNYIPDEELYVTSKIDKRHYEADEMEFEQMYVMADLGSEICLFSIQWNEKEHTLLVYPDFNCMEINPYYKEIQGDSRQMYHFGLQNLTKRNNTHSGSKETIHIKDALIDKLTKLSLREQQLKDQFCLPDNHQLQFLILLELAYGKEFSYDNSHIRYTFSLPIEAKVVSGSLDGCTHASNASNGVWHYGHCHELMIKLPERHDIDDALRIVFEVISIDSWKRERLLGNAAVTIPLQPQCFETSLDCLNIANNNAAYDKLEAFLVGGRREINIKEFFGLNDSLLLNRYGSKSQYAGKLAIKCQILQQHRPQIVQLSSSQTRKSSKFRANVVTIEELLSSYQRARERLEEVVNLKY
ncbi:tectonic-like complex member Mks1 [Uranotaenia lowii]|uniref:tectonic-like complex member Mks1 n=1 Tax=Uranotaenia lowii TaxID=190385 RepID=UPI002478F667|nr:tectonic-like complex member Mks1 [Uranotaenia lowii]